MGRFPASLDSLGSKGHEHPVLPVQQISQEDPAGWFFKLNASHRRPAREVMDLAVYLCVPIETSWIQGPSVATESGCPVSE